MVSPRSAASTAAPERRRPIVPSRDRVPSAKMSTLQPSFSMSISSVASLAPSPLRWMGTVLKASDTRWASQGRR
jgi:hypothetical protein